jgi:hypothetical protein
VNDRHGKLALSILATLIVLLVISNLATRSTSPRATGPAYPSGTVLAPAQVQPTVASTMSAPTQPTPRAQIEGQDRYYYTHRFRDYERQQQIARPAYQHLPYRTSQVRIDIANVTSDGRIVLTVTPLGPDVNPRAEYEKFLAHFHDPGSAYLARYARYPS